MANKKENKQKINPFSEMEHEVLDFWKKAETFEKSILRPGSGGQAVKKEAPNGDYVFYDGPPFATGLPHYGHIVASVMKDTVPRYWTMKGYRVERKWGWDCHGLPIENLAEKELELKDKNDIEKIGVEKFNSYCASIVMRYAKEWKKIIHRIGRWVDMENDYKTMDSDYMESIWWVFKTLWDKGLIYKGHKAMHICPRCGTTLSNFEVTQGYKNIKDLSAITKFKVNNPANLQINYKFTNYKLRDDDKVYILAWTTTPWTLIGNVALAVGKDIEYVLVKRYTGERNENQKAIYEYFIIAESIFEKWKEEGKYGFNNFDDMQDFPDGGNHVNNCVIKELKGQNLVGLEYEPLFDYYSKDEKLENRENGWKVYAADFVSTEEGTGVVHIAPAFGEDDMNLGKEHNLPFVQHVDGMGRFKDEVVDFPGAEVKPKDNHMATDIEIIKYLAHNNLLFHKEKYEHSYPHCWRCDTPLLNYATESWFIEVTKIRDNLIANNRNIRWVPKHIKDGRFGKWLEQARDWAISRNRYWGSPLPVWECDRCGVNAVVGSIVELEELSGVKADNLHKQFVDKITWECKSEGNKAKCRGTMRRIPEVLDCWFESGSMPYAQMHYLGEPLSNFDPRHEINFPAQFIAEGVDQTRGWFYTLMVLSTALFNKEAFKSCIVNGIVLAEDGQKMSKRLSNYPDPAELFEKYSVDAMRYYLLSSPVLIAENLNFSEDGVKEAHRKVAMLLWNVYKFYAMYAKDDANLRVDVSPQTMNKRDLKRGATNAARANDTNTNVLDRWILARLDQLTKEITKNMDSYVIPKAIRPIGKFIDDLSTWYLRRSRDRYKGDNKTDKVSALQTTGIVLVELSKLMAPFTPFISEQVWQKVTGYNFKNENKSVHLESWPVAGEVDSGIINKMEHTRKIVELGLAKRDKYGIKVRQPLNELRVKPYEPQEDYIELIKAEVNVKKVVCEQGDGELSVDMDTKITPELKQEGIKRELVRFINNMRKNAGLTIKDKIEVYWNSGDEIREVVEKFKDDLMKDTLSLDIIKKDDIENSKEVKVNGEVVVFGIARQ